MNAYHKKPNRTASVKTRCLSTVWENRFHLLQILPFKCRDDFGVVYNLCPWKSQNHHALKFLLAFWLSSVQCSSRHKLQVTFKTLLPKTNFFLNSFLSRLTSYHLILLPTFNLNSSKKCIVFQDILLFFLHLVIYQFFTKFLPCYFDIIFSIWTLAL